MSLADRVLGLLGAEAGEVVVSPSGSGPGSWAGGPSAVLEDGAVWLAHRSRDPARRGFANTVARSTDGIRFEPVAVLTPDRFGAASIERPALVRRPDGGWRLYVSCATPGTKHWWVEAVDADEPAGLAAGRRTVVLPGDATAAWKDPVVLPGPDGWLMWACRHPLDGGDDQADRMSSWRWRSDDGLRWTDPVEALAPGPEGWDARGRRITAVVPGTTWTAFYDGRASAAEDFGERTAAAAGTPEAFHPVTGPTRAGRALRYLAVLSVPGGSRLYWEAQREDGAHDLRTALLAD